MHLSELKAMHVSALLEMAIGLDIDNAARLRKQELMFAILKKRAKQGEQIFGDGVLELLGQSQAANKDLNGALDTYSKLVNVLPKAPGAQLRPGMFARADIAVGDQPATTMVATSS